MGFTKTAAALLSEFNQSATLAREEEARERAYQARASRTDAVIDLVQSVLFDLPAGLDDLEQKLADALDLLHGRRPSSAASDDQAEAEAAIRARLAA
jgi:hypothetical protein